MNYIDGLIDGFLGKAAAVRRASGERERVPMGVGLYPNASGYGIHDKRTGDDNRLLAYGVGTTGAAVVSGLTSGAYRAVFGKSPMKSLMSIPRSGTKGYEKGIKEIFRPDVARDTLKDIAGKARKGKIMDAARYVAGLRGGRADEYIDWGKASKRFGKGLQTPLLKVCNTLKSFKNRFFRVIFDVMP